ncbi:unnamed protein product [Rhizophagus irregularis]|nr:unnamed protein product [Rhizophagus irregularis]
MPSISVKVILSNRKEVLKWQIHPIIGNPSLSEFFHSLAIGQISPEVFINKDYQSFLLKAKIGNSLKDEFVDVNVQCELNEISQNFGNFVLFELQIPEDYQPVLQKEKDAFKVLISNSTQLSLPSFNYPKKPNKKDLLHQNIVAWIKNNNGGWKGKIAAESMGKSFVNDLLNAIWYVDTCGVEKMKGRAIHPPKEFEEFFYRSDPSSYKNARPNFDYDCLNRYANLLFGYLNAPWMENSQFTWLYPIVEKFTKCLNEYSTYLNVQRIEISENHQLEIPIRSIDDSISVKVYEGVRFFSNFQTKNIYDNLNNKLSTLPYWEVLDIEPFVPSEPRKKYAFIHNLPENIYLKFGIFRYSSGNSTFHACFLWRVDESLGNEEITNKSYIICEDLKSKMPTYHTRFMRKQFKYKADLILGIPTKNHQARALYQELTGDSSSATNMTEKQVMLRVKQLLANGDDKIIVDLRSFNKGRPEQYAEFWKYVKQFLEEHAAVDDRRHGTVAHLSHAISVRDLINQVTKICPSGTLIPSKQWLRMQFSPNNETVKVSEYYTGKLDIKYMVQARQLRIDHPDLHYASALFRYEKEMSIKYKEYSNLVFLDDKHRCKVGEPNYPVAAVDRGKSVIVANGMTFAVADHDFTKCGLIPSVIMQAEIPNTINESFYRDKNFETFEAASEFDMNVLWDSILRIDSTLTKEDKSWANIKNKPISEFFDHCCQSRSYFFSIKKCGKDNCDICLPIRSPQHVFDTLYHLPDPSPANDEHYKNFNDVYGTDTNESYCPSIQLRKAKLNKNKKEKKRDKQMPWTGNAQKAKNVGMTVTCADCNKLRCLYASKKITDDEKKILVAYLDTICYTCGATFALSNKLELEDEPVKESSRKRNIEASENDNILSDVESEEEIEVSDEEFISTEDNVNIGTKRDDIDRELKNVLSKVFVNAALECYDEMEKAYYSANFLPICFNCGSPEYVTPVPEKQYPYCETCTTDPNVLIKTGRGLNFSSNSIQSGERKEKRSKRK